MSTTDNSTAAILPSTMTGPPIASLTTPGNCQFKAEEFTSVPLLKRWTVSETTKVLRFGLPDTTKSLGLSTCACILAQANIRGDTVIRPYTPISTNADVGYFDLLIKNYPQNAAMSQHMTETLEPGTDSIAFKHIKFNVKIQYEPELAKLKKIGMLVGGTGITPMIQALHAILGSKTESKTKVTMLYGSRVSTDILGKEILDQWVADYAEQLEVVHILSHEPADSNWKGPRGFVDQKLMEQHFPSPTESDFKILVCGPPPMYNALSGPREEADKVSGILGEMGYTAEQVYKY